jgi:DNA polymerase-4
VKDHKLPDGSRSILNLDLNNFFIAVERLGDKRLQRRPLIIGGMGDRASVVACSDECRGFGVQPEMPMKLAIQLCPEAVFLPGDVDAYARFSHMVGDIVRERAPLFEKSGIDEYYVDLTGMDRYIGLWKWSGELRQALVQQTHLPISMGLSINKLVSKVAACESKPNGRQHIRPSLVQQFLAPLSIRALPMVGSKTADFLIEMGVSKIATLRKMPVQMLEAAFGRNGRIIWQRAHGIDDSPVVPNEEPKMYCGQCSFSNDTFNPKEIEAALTAKTEKLAFQLRSGRKLCSCVQVKIKYADFETVHSQLQIPYTAADRSLIAHVLHLFGKLDKRRLLVRQIGVRFSGLVSGGNQINLFDDTERELELQHATDRMKRKYGLTAVLRASSLPHDGAHAH